MRDPRLCRDYSLSGEPGCWRVMLDRNIGPRGVRLKTSIVSIVAIVGKTMGPKALFVSNQFRYVGAIYNKERYMRRLNVLFATGVLVAVALAGCSSDKKTETAATTAGGGVTVPTATGTPVAVTAGDTNDTTQFLKADPVSVAAGPTTFTLTNSGKKKHEMVVLKTDDAIDSLKVDTATNKVSEDTTVGEVGETDIGKTGVVTIDLKPGKYILVCNIEKHYAQGMRVAFTVTG